MVPWLAIGPSTFNCPRFQSQRTLQKVLSVYFQGPLRVFFLDNYLQLFRALRPAQPPGAEPSIQSANPAHCRRNRLAAGPARPMRLAGAPGRPRAKPETRCYSEACT